MFLTLVLVLVFELCDDGGVGERRRVAQDAAFCDIAQAGGA